MSICSLEKEISEMFTEMTTNLNHAVLYHRQLVGKFRSNSVKIQKNKIDAFKIVHVMHEIPPVFKFQLEIWMLG